MLDFGAIKRYIYFPHSYDRERDPYVIHVLERWGDSWKGNRDLQELVSGRFSFYALRRCQPWSEELWKSCQAWSERRLKLASDFETLMKKGR